MDFWQKIGPLRVVDYEHEGDEDGSILPALYRAMEIEIPRGATRIFLNTRT